MITKNLLLVLTVCIIVAFISSCRNNESKQAKSVANRDSLVQVDFETFAAEKKAIAFPPIDDIIYTSDLQEQIKSNSRVAFNSFDMDDIYTIEGKSYARFKIKTVDNVYYLETEVPSAAVNQLKKDVESTIMKRDIDDLFIICSIDSVINEKQNTISNASEIETLKPFLLKGHFLESRFTKIK